METLAANENRETTDTKIKSIKRRAKKRIGDNRIRSGSSLSFIVSQVNQIQFLLQAKNILQCVKMKNKRSGQ